MTITKLTPNLYTDDVAACVKFWVDRLQFEKTVEVPGETGIMFAALQKDGLELMYGSYASLELEANIAGAFTRGTGFLFLEVDDVDVVAAAMHGVPMVMPMHKTFYGATEVHGQRSGRAPDHIRAVRRELSIVIGLVAAYTVGYETTRTEFVRVVSEPARLRPDRTESRPALPCVERATGDRSEGAFGKDPRAFHAFDRHVR